MKHAPNLPLSDRVALSINEAGVASGLSPDKIRDEVRAGRLIARKVGRRTIITTEDLSRWLAGLPAVVPQ